MLRPVEFSNPTQKDKAGEEDIIFRSVHKLRRILADLEHETRDR